jgi:hypothetical protein
MIPAGGLHLGRYIIERLYAAYTAAGVPLEI